MKSHMFYFTILIFFMFSCGNDNSFIRQSAQHELQIRIKNYRVELLEECKQEALLLAEEYVDSIILLREILPGYDSLYHPDIRQKPEFVELDSVKLKSQNSVKPILDTIPHKR